ncbi:heparan-alpha-glucosaminide N-acetyltransferase domain-containing protein [Aquimarina aggregata]|uniref:heparan-alpha-glucosaminide N-acetyltransferase domain-containing protein n=1 Tax=Aquimarina aggregata TaxID=1642818 RepID=UPI002492CBD0|nr:heparan-alpha-glucosaminide N-acetyltransferase domain-containing protein [Aquimarina aggregata]
MITSPNNRLHFLDAIRAFAIIMMLQGHFVYTLLADEYRDTSNTIFNIWEYFRGMTAPTFFTITGFIFTFLLLKQGTIGIDNPRVLKGVKRAIKVILWGYLLRLSLYALYAGGVNPSFYYVDVLQCIGTSLLLLIGIYLIASKYGVVFFQNTILVIGTVIFLLQPMYEACILEFLPKTIANYFTHTNGSIFTIFPWFGYVCFGGFMASLFLKYLKQKDFYRYAIMVYLLAGFVLMYFSSSLLMSLHDITSLEIFKSVAYNNFLFIRLGNVCVLFAVFIILRNLVSHPVVTKVGGKTLSIYILHFFILYGSWFEFGLNRFFYRALAPTEALVGALLFVIGICALVLCYFKYQSELKLLLHNLLEVFYKKTSINFLNISATIKDNMVRSYKKIRYNKR